jgi:hypothetical protein
MSHDAHRIQHEQLIMSNASAGDFPHVSRHASPRYRLTGEKTDSARRKKVPHAHPVNRCKLVKVSALRAAVRLFAVSASIHGGVRATRHHQKPSIEINPLCPCSHASWPHPRSWPWQPCRLGDPQSPRRRSLQAALGLRFRASARPPPPPLGAWRRIGP